MSFSNSAAAGAAGSPSSKDPYEAFLEQANSTLGGDPVSSSAVAAEVGVPEKGTTPAVDADHADVPEPLLKVQQNLIYVSDTDSEFEPVRWKVGNLDKDVLDRLSRLNKKVDLSMLTCYFQTEKKRQNNAIILNPLTTREKKHTYVTTIINIMISFASI